MDLKNIATFSQDVQNVFEDQDTYANFSRLMVDTAKGVQVGYSKEEANEAIREKFYSILGVDKTASRKDLRRAIQRHKQEVFEVIEDTVEDLLVSGWGSNPFFDQFVEIKNLNDGDTNEFYTEDKTVLTVSKISGNHHDLLRQKLGYGEKFSVITGWYGLKFYAEYELFMAGKVDWARLTNKLFEAVDTQFNNMIYPAVMAAGAQVPNASQFNKTGALVKDTLIELVEDVQAATGKEAVIMGTKSALSKLTALSDVQWISDSMKEERHSTGRLGLFEGIRLVEIPQSFAPNDTTNKLVDNNKLLIMPVADNKFIKVVYEGDAQIREISNGDTNMDKTVEYEYQYKMGVATVIGYYFGTWTIGA